MEKIYKVVFMEYTSSAKDTVSNGDEENTKFINVGKDPFLIRESEIDKYIKYGNGFYSIEFVGNIDIIESTPVTISEVVLPNIGDTVYEIFYDADGVSRWNYKETTFSVDKCSNLGRTVFRTEEEAKMMISLLKTIMVSRSEVN